MVLRADEISKKYCRKSGEANWFYAVKPVSLSLKPGSVTVLCGRSGSGKTTLLSMLAGVLTPTEGRIYLDETDLYSLPDGELSRLRNRTIGLIPQGRSVLDTLTVTENILLPGGLYADSGSSLKSRTEAAGLWLDRLEIGHLAHAPASELSGGELRRTAIARTMCGKPAVILADEPTGDLDDENTALVLRCFREAADEGAAVFIVSHETDAMEIADTAMRMNNGEAEHIDFGNLPQNKHFL